MLSYKIYNLRLGSNFEVIPVGLSQSIGLLYAKNTSLRQLEKNFDQFW